MKKKIFSSVIIVSLFIVLINNYNKASSSGYADKLYNLEGYKFVLSQLTEEEELQDINFIIDSNGHFYSEVLNGNYKGDFEAWDGNTFYRYDAKYNHLTKIENEPGEKIISHPFFSEVINERISNDIKEGQLKKKFFSQKFIKKTSIENHVMEEKVDFNLNINHPERYEKIINGEVEEFIEIKNVTEYSNTLNLKQLINLEKLLKSNVKILES